MGLRMSTLAAVVFCAGIFLFWILLGALVQMLGWA